MRKTTPMVIAFTVLLCAGMAQAKKPGGQLTCQHS
jgi:hypothetical protein